MSTVTGGSKIGVPPVPTAALVVAGIDGSGNVQALLLDANGSLSPGLSTNVTLYPSASRAATPAVVNQTNTNCVGIVVVINVTAVPGSAPSTVVAINGVDNLGVSYQILASAAITGTGTTVLRVYPNLTAAANTAATALIPRTFNITPTHGNANAMTYSITYSLIP